MALFDFPDPVNEKAARAVAAQVLITACAVLVLSLLAGAAWLWLTGALAAGFLARVLTGPTLSPFARIATRIVAPRLGAPKPVSGPPKRFAQGIGLAVSAAATVSLASGHPGITRWLLVVLLVAAGLEAIFGYCLGCRVFGLLVRWGLVPERVCVECADITLRVRRAAASPS